MENRFSVVALLLKKIQRQRSGTPWDGGDHPLGDQ